VSFGLTFEKLLLIGLIAVFLIGPDRLPVYSAKLARLIRSLRDMASGAKERLREEMGPDFDEVEWKKLDPRQYDPRRIVREALVESAHTPAKPVTPGASAHTPSAPGRVNSTKTPAALDSPALDPPAFDPDAV
jgi:sec-independent protein translocase protein TatB